MGVERDFNEQVVQTFLKNRGNIIKIVSTLPISEAQVHRVMNQAVEEGRISPEMRKPKYLKQLYVQECMKANPHASIRLIASMTGISETSIFRYNREMVSDFESSSD